MDKKIENNERILHSLEKIIHSEFELFYNSLQIQSTVGKNFICLLGGTPNTSNPEYWDGDINWINSGEINNLRVCCASKKITKLGMEKSATKMLKKGTTVIAITGATLGQISLLEIDTCANQSVIGVCSEKYGKEYIYPLINHHLSDLISKQTGGAQQHINMNDVKSLEIKLPNESEYNKYIQRIAPLFDKQSAICQENLKLAELKQLYLKKFFG